MIALTWPSSILRIGHQAENNPTLFVVYFILLRSEFAWRHVTLVALQDRPLSDGTGISYPSESLLRTSYSWVTFLILE